MNPTELNLNWTAPRCINTRRGVRSLATASPNDAFWEAYNEDKDKLREAGITLSRDKAGAWQVCKWAMPDQEPVERVSSADLSIPVPDGLAYMPFQIEGIAHLAAHPNALLAHEMGLGKSCMALGLLNLKPEILNTLIICPASLKLMWRNEARKWLVRETRVTLINGGKPVAINPGITIINYDIVKKHLPALHKMQWDLIVCDEAHYIKSAKAARSKAVLGGGRGKDKTPPLPSKRFIALTGTPIPNRPIEIYPIMHRIAPHAFGNYYAFGHKFCDAKPGFGGSLDVSGASNLGELQMLLKSNGMIRRLKKDVLTELPDKTKQVIELPPTRAIKRILDEELRVWKTSEETIAALRERREQAQKAGNESQFRELGLKLNDAMTVRMQDMSRIRAELAELKAPYVIEYLRDTLAETQQVIVFAHHRSLMEAIRVAMERDGCNPVQIHGEISQADRQAAVEAFQAGESRVFIGSIQAAGTGITLTASSTVLFSECDWTPGNMDQAADRAHRIGQKENVLIQYLVMEQSLDAKMLQKVIGKADNIDRALDLPVVQPVRQQPELDLGLPKPEPLDRDAKRREWIDKAKEAGKALDIDQREAALQAIQMIAANDSDQAQEQNGIGFNKFDSRKGRELALKQSLDDHYEAGYALHLCRKYRTQLPNSHLKVLGLE